MASKTSAGISVKGAAGIKNVFVNDWKPKFFDDPKKRIASIPFIRNIIEFTKGDADPDFILLTSLLHLKAGTNAVTQADLDAVYRRTFGSTAVFSGPAGGVIDSIFNEADDCLKAPDGANFENKIVLSIAIRLAAEKYMVAKIADPNFVAAITVNQTSALTKRFKQQFPGETNAINILQRVVLMTPENIHLNSFMYEPILDMSDEHLRKLYQGIRLLK